MADDVLLDYEACYQAVRTLPDGRRAGVLAMFFDKGRLFVWRGLDVLDHW